MTGGTGGSGYYVHYRTADGVGHQTLAELTFDHKPKYVELSDDMGVYHGWR